MTIKKKWLGICLFLGCLMVLGTSYVFAHVELTEASPEIGAIYRWFRPTEVRLRFSAPLEAEGNQILVLNRAFEEMQQDSAQRDPDDPTVMSIPLPELSLGTYTVNWIAQSDDGHEIQGSYDFTIFPREPLFTGLVALIVLPIFGLLIYKNRARNEEGE